MACRPCRGFPLQMTLTLWLPALLNRGSGKVAGGPLLGWGDLFHRSPGISPGTWWKVTGRRILSPHQRISSHGWEAPSGTSSLETGKV